MSSNLRSARNVGEDITFLYRKPRLMHPILPQNRHSWVTHHCPRLCPHMMAVLFITTDNLINRGSRPPFLINEEQKWYRGTGAEEMVIQSSWIVWILWRASFGCSYYALKRSLCLKRKKPDRGLHYGKYSSISGQGQLRVRAYCLPLEVMLTQNIPTKPITGCSRSDIHKKCSILSFKWSFPLVTHALHFH